MKVTALVGTISHRLQLFLPPRIRHWLGPVWLAGWVMMLSRSSLLGQNLRLSSAAASRGDQIGIELFLESPGGKEPLALQWETKIPISQISLINDKVLTGSTAAEAGKTLTCAVREKTAEVSVVRCILAGGQKPIPDGAIAMFRLKISTNAKIGSSSIRVEQPIAVLKDLKQIPLDAVETIVVIRR
jgi:hypothetical protein